MTEVRRRADARDRPRYGVGGGLPALLVAALVSAAIAQVPVAPDELARLKAEYLAAQAAEAGGVAERHLSEGVLTATLSDRVGVRQTGGRGAGDLYVGLQPTGNGFWFWTLGGSEVVYWALDDGKMGPGAAAVGGGHVTQYEFSFGLHADFPNDTLRPYVIVSFYNAPCDPVAQATNPVVEPPAPVSSIGWLFNPITLPAAGFYAVRSGLIDLAALGLDFDLDETFYVEILPAEWSSYPDGAPVLDPDVFAIFTGPGTVTYGTNQNTMWSDRWVLNSSCNIVWSDGDGFYDHPAEMDACNDPVYRNQSGIILRGLECPGAKLELSVEPEEELCVGDTVSVTLSMSCIPGLVRGYQAFLSFDPTRLSFVSGGYTSEPFGLPIIYPIVADGGNIDLAAGIDDLHDQEPTSTSAVLATLTFTALTSGTTQVAFRTHDPPTRLSDEFGQEVVPTLVNTPVIAIDISPPVITCPPDVDVNADAGLCSAAVDPGTATATDNCDASPLIEYKRSDRENWNEGLLDPYRSGTTTITWRATDDWGNYAECVQTIEVSSYNELVVTVQLQPAVSTPLTRCITFELWDCPATSPLATVEEELTFVGGVASATLEVPCASYDCITARDRLHTLRRTDEAFTIVGKQYVADFTGDPAGGGDWLIGGNLNGDFWVDILDYGVFAWQWGASYGTGNTTCSTPYPHADISGNGAVWSEDFVFIQINFLKGHEANCCGQPGLRDGDEPVTRISVEQLVAMGLPELAAGDLNGDGWLDVADVVAFLEGARPRPQSAPDCGHELREDVRPAAPARVPR